MYAAASMLYAGAGVDPGEGGRSVLSVLALALATQTHSGLRLKVYMSEERGGCLRQFGNNNASVMFVRVD